MVFILSEKAAVESCFFAVRIFYSLKYRETVDFLIAGWYNKINLSQRIEENAHCTLCFVLFYGFLTRLNRLFYWLLSTGNPLLYNGEEYMIIKNGTILTMDGGKIIEKGFIRTEGKLISALGEMKDCPADDKDVIDAAGQFVLPGLVEAHCHIGLMEDGLGFEGDDINEDSDPVTPHLRAIDGINPFDHSFEEAWRAGVTTVVTGPGSANAMGGSFVAMKTYGKWVDRMILKNPAAIKCAFGENPKSVYHDKNQSPVTRMATAALIREQLSKAREYLDVMEKYENGEEDCEKPEYDAKCESLLPLLRGEIQMKAHAHRADDMMTAVRIAKEFHLDYTLDHCTDGRQIKEELKELNAKCLVGPCLCERSKPELKNLSFQTPKELSEMGMDISLITDHPVIPINYLPLCATLAWREGMEYQKALEAITINPARSVGIDAFVGSLKEGKHADIVVFDKQPLDIMAHIMHVMIEGKIII